MADLNTITKVELIKDPPAQTSIGATDLYLLQTSVQSFKPQHSDLVANLVDNSTITVNGLNKLTVSNNVIQGAYPVGSIYLNASNSSNPASLLGFGVWEAFGSGRFLVGFDNSDTDFNSSEKTGGQKEPTMPPHTHELTSKSGTADNGTGITGNTTQTTSSESSGNETNGNLPPYITAYIWERTS